MIEQAHVSPPLTLLRRPEVSRRTGLARTTLYNRLKVGTFPKPVYLTPTTPAWVEEEVAGWIARLVTERDTRQAQAAQVQR